jgi:hypothetical protein
MRIISGLSQEYITKITYKRAYDDNLYLHDNITYFCGNIQYFTPFYMFRLA